MTTTQIIVAFGSFTFAIAVLLIGVIWNDAKKSISNSVSEKQCSERVRKQDEAINYLEKHLGSHIHDDETKKVRVEI